jgi:hypothetical protein
MEARGQDGLLHHITILYLRSYPVQAGSPRISWGMQCPSQTVGRVVPLHADQGARSGMHLQVSDHGPSSHHCLTAISLDRGQSGKSKNRVLRMSASRSEPLPNLVATSVRARRGPPSSPAPHWAFEKRTETWSQSQDGRQVIGLGTFNLFGDCLGRGPTTVVGLAMHPESEQGSFATFRATFPIQPDLFTLGPWCMCRA